MTVTREQVETWVAEAKGPHRMQSALWEYCPEEFETLAAAYLALLPADEPKKKYYIVWNADKSEGFVTDDEAAAKNAHKATRRHRERGGVGVSSLGSAFADYYREDAEDKAKAPKIQAVEL